MLTSPGLIENRLPSFLIISQHHVYCSIKQQLQQQHLRRLQKKTRKSTSTTGMAIGRNV
jgi:hypothetical protein